MGQPVLDVSGAQGPVWRLREPADDAGGVGGGDTAHREELSCLS